MPNLARIAEFTKYSNKFIDFTQADCERIKSCGEEPFGWVELLSDKEGNPTTDTAFDKKVLNAFEEGNNCNLNGFRANPNCYLARHNGEKGILIIGVDIVLLGTEYEKTDRSLIDEDKLIARSCDKAELDDRSHKKHRLGIDLKLKIWVRTGFIFPESSVGIFIFVPENSKAIEYFTAREQERPRSRIPHFSDFLYSAMELDFNPRWQQENMLKEPSKQKTLPN